MMSPINQAVRILRSPDEPSGGSTYTTLSTTPSINTEAPSLALLPDGGYVLAWQDTLSDGTNTSVVTRWQRYDAQGQAVSDVVELDVTGTYSPHATSLADGGFAISYQTYQGLHVQRFDAAMNAVGGAVTVDSSPYVGFNTITSLPDGGFLSAYRSISDDGTWSDILQLRRFDAAGLEVGTVQQINTVIYGNLSFPSVTVLADGGYIVCWQNQQADANWSYGIAMRRFNSSNQPVGGEIEVNPSTSNEFAPSVVGLADGGWVVTWSADRGDIQDIFAQVFNADGSARGSEIHLAESGYQTMPALAALADGGFFMAYQSNGDIEGLRFDSAGTALGNPFVINQVTAGEQGRVCLTTGADGGLVVAWQTDGIYGPLSSDPFSYNWGYTGGTVTSQVLSASEVSLLHGTLGADSLAGGDGADIYLASGGADTILNQGHGGDGDILRFGAGVSEYQLWFEQQVNDLKVSVIGTNDSVVIADWFTDPANQLSGVEAAGSKSLAAADVQSLVSAMAAFSPPAFGQTQLNEDQLTQLQPVIAAAWQ